MIAPIAPVLLHQMLEASARRLPDKIALVCANGRWRYADIESLATRCAAALRAHGIVPGDRVAVHLESGLEAVVAIYGVLKAGAVLVPVNPLSRAARVRYLLDDAQAAAYLVDAHLLRGLGDLLGQMPALRLCAVAGADAAAFDDARAIGFDRLLAGAAPIEATVIDTDLAAIIYTSGSTGEPKGAMLSHLNMRAAGEAVIDYLALAESDVVCSALPLAFSYGLHQLLTAFRVGATLVLERSFAFPLKVLQTMAREGATVFPGVPAMYAALLNLGDRTHFDLPHLRALTNAAAALPVEHVRRLRAAFPRARLFLMYGQTECKRASYLVPEEVDARPDSVGRGMPNQAHWLIDETGRRLPPTDSQGELVVRGSHVMRGYWRRPQETAQKLHIDAITGEHVLHTGDIFRCDALGYLYFVARKDDIIKSRGEKVSPVEVENVLHALAGVVEAAVIGVPDPLLGQAIKAFVVLAPGVEYGEREVIKHCLARLESYMAPKQVVFVASLPKTESGKITKNGLA